MKFGYQGVRDGWDRHFDYDTRVNYIFNNAQPVALLMNVGAWDITNVTAWGRSTRRTSGGFVVCLCRLPRVTTGLELGAGRG